MFCDLTGKCALVTGSSRGIGSAIAIELAKGGADIILHYVEDEINAADMQKIIREMGGRCELIQGDLSNPYSVKEMAAQLRNIDILVLNASMQIRKAWEIITEEDYFRQMNCNFFSSVQLIQLFVPHMRQNHWGRIITIGSVQEEKPHPDMLIYSASKAAQTNMVKSLAVQLSPDGITVNNVAPGVIKTDRNTQALNDSAYAKQVLARIPAGYFGEKEDCAGIVRLLCAEEGRYITGQSIFVDGAMGL